MVDDLDALIESQKAAKPIIEHFTKDRVEAEVERELADLADHHPSPLDFKELSEQLCAEIAEAESEADFWGARLKSLKDQAKKIAGKERGLLRYGHYTLEIKESRGRTSVKWEKYVKDQMGEDAVAEAKAKYSETGDPIVSLSVKALKSSGDLSGGGTGERTD